MAIAVGFDVREREFDIGGSRRRVTNAEAEIPELLGVQVGERLGSSRSGDVRREIGRRDRVASVAGLPTAGVEGEQVHVDVVGSAVRPGHRGPNHGNRRHVLPLLAPPLLGRVRLLLCFLHFFLATTAVPPEALAPAPTMPVIAKATIASSASPSGPLFIRIEPFSPRSSVGLTLPEHYGRI